MEIKELVEYEPGQILTDQVINANGGDLVVLSISSGNEIPMYNSPAEV